MKNRANKTAGTATPAQPNKLKSKADAKIISEISILPPKIGKVCHETEKENKLCRGMVQEGTRYHLIAGIRQLMA